MSTSTTSASSPQPDAQQVIPPPQVTFDRADYPMGSIPVNPNELCKCGEMIFKYLLGCRDVSSTNDGASTPGVECYTLTPPTSTEPLLVKAFFKDDGRDFPGKFGYELKNINRLEHPFIVKFHDAFKIFYNPSSKVFQVVNHDVKAIAPTEYMFGGIMQQKLVGTLDTYLSRLGLPYILNKTSFNCLFMQLGSALDYMHRVHSMVHKDISILNVGVTSFDKTCPNFVLFDFGGSTIVQDTNNFVQAQEHSRANFDTVPTSYQIKNGIDIDQNLFLLEANNFADLLVTCSVKNTSNKEKKIAEFKGLSKKGYEHIDIVLRLYNPGYKTVTISHVWNLLGFA